MFKISIYSDALESWVSKQSRIFNDKYLIRNAEFYDNMRTSVKRSQKIYFGWGQFRPDLIQARIERFCHEPEISIYRK